MNDTHTIPDSETLELLEFDPECGFHSRVLPEPSGKCCRPAQWSAMLPCCSHCVLFCQEHAVTAATTHPLKCLCCGGLHTNRLGWVWVIL